MADLSKTITLREANLIIRNLTKEQSQMILAVNLIIRVLVYKIMLGVKGWYQNVLTNQAQL